MDKKDNKNDKQIIISIGREYGSGGHLIAEKIANHFGITLYDSNLLDIIASEKNVETSSLRVYDEIPRVHFFSRKVRGESNSMQENVANMQFDYLRKRAAEGKSFVVVGRCAEEILKDNAGLISIFILADKEDKIKRIMKIHKLNEEDAWDQIARENQRRKIYHNYYSKGKWGDSRNYDFSINDSVLGIEETTEVIIEYINRRIKQM